MTNPRRIAFRYVAGLAENHTDINGLVQVSGKKGLDLEQGEKRSKAK